MIDILVSAFGMVVDPQVLLTIFLASIMGIVIGAIPGLTAVMGTALLVPVTFYLPPLPAIAAIVSMTAMAIFAGDIPGGLVRIPGTPASAAYVGEAYALTLKGHPERGLGMCLISAVVGGILGSIVLMAAAPQLARIAVQFSSAEYFWLAALGLTSAAFVSAGNPLKGVISILIGLFLSTIGIDITAGQVRYTFGISELKGGLSYIPALIGMFALSEILRNVVSPSLKNPEVKPVKNVLKGIGSEAWKWKKNIFRGGTVGTLIGALPGASADIAAWVAYAISRKTSKYQDKFGHGHLEGLAEAGAANNGALSGAWVPTLVFGIPGDSITAIVIGVLILKGMEPGPQIFITQPALVYAIFFSFFLANLLLLPIGYAMIRMSRLVLRVPQTALLPIVLVACMVGSFAINNTLFGVSIMLAMGVLGWFMESNDFPVAPAILGIVLGQMVEFNFTTAMIKSQGDWSTFFARPIAAGIGAVTVSLWMFQLVTGVLRTLKARKENS
jgi:TctA family transporter